MISLGLFIDTLLRVLFVVFFTIDLFRVSGVMKHATTAILRSDCCDDLHRLYDGQTPLWLWRTTIAFSRVLIFVQRC
jgi:hypothetical protein